MSYLAKIYGVLKYLFKAVFFSKCYRYDLTYDVNLLFKLNFPTSFLRKKMFYGLAELPPLSNDFFSTDFISNQKISNQKISRFIKYKNLKDFDIKFLWDLSRFQFIEDRFLIISPQNNKDYLVNKKVFLEYIYVFKMFNKPYRGANWMCTMDVSIRSVNILYTNLYFRNAYSDIFDSKEQTEISNLLIDHLYFIKDNLEWVPNKRGNHYLSNICGIIILASAFELTNETKSLLNFSINEFIKELELQVNEDGSYFENSSGYHRLYLEMFFYTLIFIESASLEVKSFLFDSIESKYIIGEDLDEFIKLYFHPLLYKGVDFAKTVTLFDGTFHQIGDNDSGRFINRDNVWVKQFINKYGNDNIRNSFYSIINDIDLYFEELGVNIFSSQLGEIYLTKNKYNKSFMLKFDSHNIVIENGLRLEKFSFPNFGLYGFKNDSLYFAFRCGFSPNSKTVHAHEDQLSFELHEKENINLLYKDKGSFTYTRDVNMRNFFRSSKSHLVPVFIDISQGKGYGVFNFKYNGDFYLNDFTHNSIEGVWHIDDRIILREIIIKSKNIIINDYVNTKYKNFVNVDNWLREALMFSPEYNVKVDI